MQIRSGQLAKVPLSYTVLVVVLYNTIHLSRTLSYNVTFLPLLDYVFFFLPLVGSH